MNLISCQTYEQLSSQAAALLVQKIKKVISAKGKAVIALPGGRSVAGLLQKLSPQDLDWSKVGVFMIDERVVPIDDRESNFKQAQELLLKRVNAKVHPFLMGKGIEQYNQQFRSAGAHFDIIVLGVGNEGHIAALFPHHPALKIRGKKYIQFHNSPKLPKERITASPDIIKDADVVILLFVSAVKKKAYELFSNPKITETECPAKIAHQAKELCVLTEFT